MADDHKFADQDLHNNKLKHAKVSIVDRADITSDAVIDKQYVNDEDKYATDASDPDTGINAGKPLIAIGGIGTDTTVHNKSNRELWDAMFYPLAPPIYTRPTVSIDADIYIDSGKNTFLSGNAEVGELLWLDVRANVVLNDSAGLNGTNPYTWYTPGSPDPIISGFPVLPLNFAAGETQSIQVDVAYLGADIKNDTHGTPDDTGQFDAGVANDEYTLNTYWPFWRHVLDGDVAAPINGDELRQISGKEIGNAPTNFDITIPGDSATKTIIIAVPVITGDDAAISAIKDGAVPIAASAWTKTRLLNVPDINLSGRTSDYIIFRHNNGVGFSTESVYSITLTFV